MPKYIVTYVETATSYYVVEATSEENAIKEAKNRHEYSGMPASTTVVTKAVLWEDD